MTFSFSAGFCSCLVQFISSLKDNISLVLRDEDESRKRLCFQTNGHMTDFTNKSADKQMSLQTNPFINKRLSK